MKAIKMAGQIEGRTHSRSPLIWLQLSSPRDYLVQLVPTRLTGFSTLGPLHQLVRLPPLNVATIKVQAAATFILKQGLLKCLNITHANLTTVTTTSSHTEPQVMFEPTMLL